jgi:uncharacterized protein
MSATESTNTVTYFEIGTPDPAAARAFYGSLFGWDLGPANPGGYAPIDGNAGGLWDTIEIGGQSWAVFYVEVADIHVTLERATAAGAETVRPLVDNGAILFAHLADPAGNRFGVWQRKVAG